MSRQDPGVTDSIEKAFRLLQVFSAQHPTLTVSEAAELSDLPRATARRILLTCVNLGFAELDDRRFRLTPRVLRLGYGYLSSLGIWERAQPHMRELADAVNESCSAATLDGDEIVYVARVPANRIMTITLTVGSRLPAYPTSMGRVLLAGLPDEKIEDYLATARLERLTTHTTVDPHELRAVLGQVRADGYAVVDGEREEGVRSAAAPVRDPSGRVLAAINVSANAARIDMTRLHGEYVPLVVKAASAITDDIALLHGI